MAIADVTGSKGTEPRFAVVMAGGSGTRFWPASRAERPKQFLPLGGESHETLLQATVRRAAALVGLEQVLVVTSVRHADATLEQLPGLPLENLLLEPLGRNTAPCLAWAAAHVRRRAPRGLIAAMPADAHIGDEQVFRETLERAFAAAASGAIATIGISPTRPETGYGYIELGDVLGDGLHRVRAFVEKPNAERAQHYMESGLHLWNSGMFFFGANVMLRQIERHLPELAAFVTECDAAAARGEEEALVGQRYPSLPSISIDYGVMEKSEGILVVRSAFGWDDLGSWAAAFTLAPKGDGDNVVAGGDLLSLEARRCYTRTREGKLVVLLGVEDLVVVDTADALLVLPRSRAQDVAKVVAELKNTRRDRHL